MTASGPALLASMAQFAQWHRASGDIDPAYPVLAHLQTGLPDEQALWHSLVYVAYYNLPSGQQAWLVTGQQPARIPDDVARLPTGTERRALRGGNNLIKHVDSLLEAHAKHGSWRGWLTHRFTGNRQRDWDALRATLNDVWGNGRWATYKTAEILAEVHGFPVAASDLGNDGSTGPKAGLEMLYGPVPGHSREAVALLDERGLRAQRGLSRLGVDMPLQQVETVLCDFHTLAHGRYYVGHDIDAMLEAVNKPHVPWNVRQAILEARAAAFDPRWLGEVNGWDGVRKELLTAYRDTGRLAWWN